jgi:hypothetical protein
MKDLEKNTNMNIKRKYWLWDSNFNDKIKIGDNIKQFVKEGKLVKIEDNNYDYYSVNGYPWKVSTNGEIIKIITYRNQFIDVGIEGIWDFEIDLFEKNMNQRFKQIEIISDENNFIEVVFRDNFVAIVNLF